jgi:TonB family protein
VNRQLFLIKNESKALWASLAVHAVIGLALFGPVARENQITDTEIELVSLPSHPSPMNSKPDRQVIQKSPAEPIIGEKTAAKPNADRTGDSDIESDLGAGAPKNEEERYLAEIRHKIAGQQSYPRSSRALGEQGTVRLRLTIQRNGSLTKVELVRGTAYERLNTAAMAAVTAAGPFKPFPVDVQYASWRIALPVHFSLQVN